MLSKHMLVTQLILHSIPVPKTKRVASLGTRKNGSYELEENLRNFRVGMGDSIPHQSEGIQFKSSEENSNQGRILIQITAYSHGLHSDSFFVGRYLCLL